MNMTAFWSKLSKRDKYAVSLASGVFLLFLIWTFGVSPFLAHREKTGKAIRSKTVILAEMIEMKAKYESLSKKGIKQAGSGESLFSFVERTSRETGLKESLASVNPSEITDPQTGQKKSRVEIRFQSVDTNQLMLFLYRIETSGQGIIENINISRTTGDKAFLNANMLIVSRQVS